MTDFPVSQSIPAPARRSLSLGSIAVIIGVLAVVVVVGIALARQRQTQPTSGTAPDFTVTTFDGETFRLSDQRGKIVIINFWASWCGPCRDEAPRLEALSRDYADRGVVVLGIAHADIDRDSQAFIERFQVSYPNAPDVGGVLAQGRYHILGVPETFIIDQNGNVARFFFQLLGDEERGDNELFVTVSSVRATLDALLANPPVAESDTL